MHNCSGGWRGGNETDRWSCSDRPDGLPWAFTACRFCRARRTKGQRTGSCPGPTGKPPPWPCVSGASRRAGWWGWGQQRYICLGSQRVTVSQGCPGQLPRWVPLLWGQGPVYLSSRLCSRHLPQWLSIPWGPQGLCLLPQPAASSALLNTVWTGPSLSRLCPGLSGAPCTALAWLFRRDECTLHVVLGSMSVSPTER